MIQEINKVEQYSAEWFNKRLGKFTSSGIWQLMVEPKEKVKKDAGELSQTAKDYVIGKVAERLTGIKREINTEATTFGVQNEPVAIELYELITGNKVTPCGFIEAIEGVYGGTPDGLIKEGNGSIQVKCPFEPKNHIYYSLTNDQDHFKRKYREHYWQIQSDMFVSQTEWCDFVSYCPYMPQGKNIFILRINKNDEDIAQLEANIVTAYKFMCKTIQDLNIDKG